MLVKKRGNSIIFSENQGENGNYMLEEVEQIQKKGYPGANVWNIQKQNFCKHPDRIISNLVA